MRIPVRELAEQHKDSIFRAASSICRNPEDAEDVVQETFLQYMESSRQFESVEHTNKTGRLMSSPDRYEEGQWVENNANEP